VIYQIYPRSFQDCNSDGVGDLAGIAQRLEYVAALGVDAVWISPFFPSPMADFGYDVSDYRDVDPLFGTLADFDALLARAHALGLKVIIDLVLSHTSDQHPWFRESRQDTQNARKDWYVWANPKPDGTPPNNWLSIFGGPAWEWDGGRRQYYLHNFLASQPDLNFHHPPVQEALLDIARFWLARGVDGFRLDTINFYFHDAQLRDNPALAPQERNDSIAPAVNPYNYQRHIYDKNRPENIEFLRKFRATLDPFGAIAMGEVGDAQRGLEILGAYTAGDALIQTCYAFEFLARERPDAGRIKEVLHEVARLAPTGWPTWAFSNHDVARHISRWGLCDAAARLYTILLICLRGTVCLYQGEELGLPEAAVPFEALQDPYGKRFWPEFAGRDGSRTPMVWTAAPGAGFSTAKPWLPIPSDHLALNVASQEAANDSLLQHYRSAIALRHASPAIARGTLGDLRAAGPVLSFTRRLDDEEIFCAFNIGPDAAPLAVPAGTWRDVGPAGDAAGAMAAGRLNPWQAAVLRRA